MSQIHDEPANEALPAAVRVRLDELKRRAGEHALREFAIWSALQVIGGHQAVAATLAAVRTAARDLSGECLRQLQAETSGAACAACVVGLKVNPAAASAHLAAFQCGRPDAYEAAVQASKHVRDFFAFNAPKDPDALSVTGRPALEAAAFALGCQIDQLDRMVAACKPPQADNDFDPTKGES
jgi:hypothetical protein